jgi:hypothetical protein
MDWLSQSWGYLVAGGAVVASVITVIATTLAAERDRQALKSTKLEYEKLELEVARLRNSPEAVSDRRAIYNRLRQIVGELTGEAKVLPTHIPGLHEIWHDASFRFPEPVLTAIRDLIAVVAKFHVAGRILERGPGRMSDSEWAAAVDEDHQALNGIVAFERSMIALFQPYLSL